MIGYYVHHHGQRPPAPRAGRRRAPGGARRRGRPGSRPLPRPDGLAGRLGAARPRRRRPDPAVDARRRRPLHWAPLGDAGLRSRMAALSALARAARPPAWSSSTSRSRWLLLARLHGVPAVVGGAARRPRPTTRTVAGATRSPTRSSASGPPAPTGMAAPAPARRRPRPGAAGRRASRGFAAVARRPGRPRGPTPGRASPVLLRVRGGHDVDARRRTPPPGRRPPTGTGPCSAAPRHLGRRPVGVLAAADVVVTHAGQNALAEVPRRARPAVVVAAAAAARRAARHRPRAGRRPAGRSSSAGLARADELAGAARRARPPSTASGWARLVRRPAPPTAFAGRRRRGGRARDLVAGVRRRAASPSSPSPTAGTTTSPASSGRSPRGTVRPDALRRGRHGRPRPSPLAPRRRGPPATSCTVGRRPGGGLPLAAARNPGVARRPRAPAPTCWSSSTSTAWPGPALVGGVRRRGHRATPTCVWSGPVTYLPRGRRAATRPRRPRGPRRPAPRPAEPRARASGAGSRRPRPLLVAVLRRAPRRTWARLGGFCEDYVGYGGEDTDFGAGARRGGRRAWLGRRRPRLPPAPPGHSPAGASTSTTSCATARLFRRPVGLVADGGLAGSSSGGAWSSARTGSWRLTPDGRGDRAGLTGRRLSPSACGRAEGQVLEREADRRPRQRRDAGRGLLLLDRRRPSRGRPSRSTTISGVLRRRARSSPSRCSPGRAPSP